MSVVVPTYNRQPRLHRVLKALAAQQGTDVFETVVVSDGSTDGTDEYLQSALVPLSVVACLQPNSGPSAARNRGVDVASGELIVFLDDDVVPGPGFVAAHAAAHRRHGDRVVVIGPMRTPPEHPMTPWVAYEQAMLAKQYQAMERGDYVATSRQFYTGNASVRREHLVAAGGFDTGLRRAEDLDLAHRFEAMGLAFVYEAGAVGWHYVERSYESWRAIGRNYGQADVDFSRRTKGAAALEFVMLTYRWRNPLIRGLVRVAVGRPRAICAAETVLLGVARIGVAARATTLSRLAMSGIFNLHYYDGVATELGGRDELLDAAHG